MSTQLIIAFLGVFSSLVIAIYSSLMTLRNQKKIVLLQKEVDEAKAEKNARRDYEYEAKKRLYNTYEPIKFQLYEYANNALGRIKGLAASTKVNAIPPSVWTGIKNYYFNETVYKIFAPLAIFNIMKKKLTSIDINLDENVSILYSLLNILYYSFQEEYKLARDRGTHYDQEYFKKWEKGYIVPDLSFRREGMSSMHIDKVTNALTIEEDGNKRIVEHWEFEQNVNRADEPFMELIKSAELLFINFDINRYPLLWTLLIVHGCVYHIILESRLKSQLTKGTILELVDQFFNEWDKKYLIGESFEKEYQPSFFAKKFLIEKINREMKS